jgi:hypothetical protein
MSTHATAWTPDEIYYTLNSHDKTWQLQAGKQSFQMKKCILCYNVMI